MDKISSKPCRLEFRTAVCAEYDLALELKFGIKNCMVLLHLFDESQTRLADFGYIPECKSKNPRGLSEISLRLARMDVMTSHRHLDHVTSTSCSRRIN